jgi:hypothetical protein
VIVGRRELSAILLAILALVFYLVLLSTVPSGAETGGDTTDGDQSIIIDDEFTVQEDENLQGDVRDREPTITNIPRKPLPPTGGLPVYVTVAVSILAGTGLLGLGVGIRRGQRR